MAEAQGKTMNKLTRTIILSTAAIATIATSVDFASARDRYPYWRKHHPRHFHDRAFVAGALGVAAGVVIGNALARPRVIYREQPVVIDQEPAYVEPDTVFADPGYEYDRPAARYEGPVDDEDNAGFDRQPYDDRAMSDDEAMGDDEFPAPPVRRTENRSHPQNDESRSDRTQVAASDALVPWTAKWRAYCSERYQTFNPQNGTFKGYDGKPHFCTAE
jgi:BA14K-like protein